LNGGYSRNVTVFADAEVDRSPTGTGVSGALTLLYKRKIIKSNQKISIERWFLNSLFHSFVFLSKYHSKKSILGTKFNGQVISEVKFGGYDAIIPEVEGTAYITGKHEFVLDPNDNLKEGFLFKSSL